MKKILAIVQHRKDRSPGQRFRFEQYMNYLQENGYEIVFSNIISEKDDKIFYSKGKYFSKFIIIIKSFFHRLKDIKIAKDCDIIFIYREAFMLGTIFFEKKFKKLGKKIIYDFDDAIWHNDTSNANKNFAWLKNTKKTIKICELADLVIVGNQFLADFALNYNKKVKIIPTTLNLNQNSILKGIPINSDSHCGLEPQFPNLDVGGNVSTVQQSKICIGWTGSDTTLKHFYQAIPTLQKLKQKYSDKIYFKVIANKYEKQSEFEVKFAEWNKENETEELLEFDIGIMPLPDNEWSKGKCGFKGLQYISLKIPVVMSAVGVNNEIIKNGKNGFLANNEDDWLNYLSELIESPELRNKIAEEGYKTVENNYSFNAWKDKYLEIFNKFTLLY